MLFPSPPNAVGLLEAVPIGELAELDDTGDWRASAHLVLGTDDLEKPQIDQASDYLCSIYEKIYRICRKESFLSNHYQWDDLLSAESESDRLHYPQLQDLR